METKERRIIRSATNRLQMSIADLAKNYREAKRKEKQIPILADLNDTRTNRIAFLLDAAGESVCESYIPKSQSVLEVYMNSPEYKEALRYREQRELRMAQEEAEKNPVEEPENHAEEYVPTPQDTEDMLKAFMDNERQPIVCEIPTTKILDQREKVDFTAQEVSLLAEFIKDNLLLAISKGKMGFDEIHETITLYDKLQKVVSWND